MKYLFLPKGFAKLSEYARLKSDINAGKFPLALSGLSHIHRVSIAASLSAELHKKLLVITAGDAETERVLEDFTSIGLSSAVFPSRDYCFRSGFGSSHEYEHNRLDTLSRILEGDFDVCIASADAVISSTVPPAILKERRFKLVLGEEYNVDELISKLVSSGYTRSEQVDGAGQFSLRGSILDIFSPGYPDPIRIDFFGDEVDSIYFFEADTQRRTDSLNEVTITPVAEVRPDSYDQLKKALEKLSNRKSISEAQKKRILEDIDRLANGVSVAFDTYLKYIYPENSTVFDYFGNDSLTLVFDTNLCLEKIDSCLKLHSEEIKELLSQGVLPPEFRSVYLDGSQFENKLSCHNTLFCDSFQKTSYTPNPCGLFNFNLRQSGGFAGSVQSLAEDIKNSGAALHIILAGGEKAANNLTEELCDLGINANFTPEPRNIGETGVFVTTGTLTEGFSLPETGLSVTVHGRSSIATKKRKHFGKGTAVGSLEELERGDYVVHITHGIGIFAGVQQISAHGITRDYIKINYAGKDALYVPVTSLDMVSKYVGSAEDTTVKLNKLGSADWSKTRTRVKKAVKDMAKQLTALYAKRMQQQGYSFSPDGDLQSDFEHRFPFEETDDQLRCSHEIKRDMERAVPMDRLLCGDVGFGKTEVAFRAAFKCIADGKQCALLVPTTILAWQHYNNALERFGNMAVEVEMLSRFRTPKQQERIKKDLKAGNVDLIIGTHSLFSKDVQFKDLGLLIVDEEQRFGVAQKERIKELYPTVDALTLSATPIPRTLNMALSGLRDMSSIEEAPLDRHPVQTYVLEQSSSIVNEAISRELRRGGQVYYLHNRTDNIETCAAKLQQSHPDARVGIAHGKMDEASLSKVWRSLTEHEIDILVCTTIIETGVDVPNANTLIIEDADRMGLAQLHQIRGRVGRSHRTAYAYLMFTPGKALTEISQKRLDAIRKFTEFGSGFRIAMRDLEIRGAGSILGGEQHGHMEAVGYDMYLKMLSDAIAEEKGEAVVEQKDCSVDLKVNAHIPERYIPSLAARLSIYRRIATIRSEDDKLDVIDELIDRFGEPPKTVTLLIDIALCKAEAIELGFTEISEQNGRLLLYSSGLTEPISRLLTSELKRRVMFSAGTKPYVSIRPESGQTSVQLLKQVLNAIKNAD